MLCGFFPADILEGTAGGLLEAEGGEEEASEGEEEGDHEGAVEAELGQEDGEDQGTEEGADLGGTGGQAVAGGTQVDGIEFTGQYEGGGVGAILGEEVGQTVEDQEDGDGLGEDGEGADEQEHQASRPYSGSRRRGAPGGA